MRVKLKQKFPEIKPNKTCLTEFGTLRDHLSVSKHYEDMLKSFSLPNNKRWRKLAGCIYLADFPSSVYSDSQISKIEDSW